ncbi:PREDICTED: uncharacterized protein LOC108576096 [Habropoda laboriosa]|uniref:uncharacterized protein LOC108576096 n=1 Tax=Habropoda laboriosa TaxID=597456 RepID=UPI00083E0CAB|nr:PREDICTED: uncharacterized protein LOC108576096 [Habropoda laboriosa]
MYMSNSTLEKLLDILRNKMAGVADQGTVAGLINAKRARNASSSSEGEQEDEGEEDEEDDGNVDDDGDTVYKEKVHERLSMIENGIKLSGPVTDL